MKERLIKATLVLGACLLTCGCGEREVTENTGLGIVGEQISAQFLVENTQESNEKKSAEAMGTDELKNTFEGTWVCGRVSLQIDFRADDQATVTVLWANSAFEMTEWDYFCTILKNGIEDMGKGHKSNIVYGAEGANPEETIDYTDGTARFEINEKGKLIWIDHKEKAGENMEFEKIENTD